MRDVQEGSIIVRLPGLQVSSFCIPALVVRQYGLPQRIIGDLRERLAADTIPMTMSDSSTISRFSRVFLDGFFPARSLIGPARGSTLLTTEYLQWYKGQRGPVQEAIEDRRLGYVGYVDSLEQRLAEAGEDPDDVTGDAVEDYKRREKRRANIMVDPAAVARREAARQERAAQAELIATGLIDPPVHRIPELGQTQTQFFDIPKPKTPRGPRKRKSRGSSSGMGTSD